MMSVAVRARPAVERPPLALVESPPAGPAVAHTPSAGGTLSARARDRLSDAFVAALEGERDLHDGELSELHGGLGEAVRCGIELSAVLDELAVAQANAWSVWLERLQQRHGSGPCCATAIAADSVRFFRLVELARAAVIARYLTELDEWNSSADALRAQTVRRILAGEAVAIESASERLGHDLTGRHVAVLVWACDPLEGSDAVRAGAVKVARRLGDGTNPVVLELEAGACAAWARLRPGQVAADAALESALPEGLTAAVGAPRDGVDGFRRTFADAHFTRQVLLRGPHDRRIARFDDVALFALLTSDLDEAGRFVGEVLGALAEPAPATRRVAETLLLYFELGASAIRTARWQGVHENTVRNRLRRAAELLGHPVDERTLDVWTALRLDDLLRGRGGAR